MTIVLLGNLIHSADKGTKEERTRRLIVVFNDENVVELQFRLDFAHYSPPNLDIEDEDEVEIQPDLVFHNFSLGIWPHLSNKPFPMPRQNLK